jgi:ABC-2 type transport system ATP-binding protein
VTLYTRGADGLLPRVVTVAQPYGLRDLSATEPTLETVFINLTGRELRD